MQLGRRFADALGLASELHAGQTRKASNVPYISHVLAVAATVLEFGGDEDTAIAALLHDTVEDCGGMATLERIRLRFGDRVADLVLGCSDTAESPKPPWRERKLRYLEHLPSASQEVLLISAADKLHNLVSLLRDERQHGSELWQFFRSGREGMIWYFERLLDIFRASAVPAELLEQLERNFRELHRRVHPPSACRVVGPELPRADNPSRVPQAASSNKD